MQYKMRRDQIENLLLRYSRDEATSAEKDIINLWLEENGNTESEWLMLNQASKDRWLSNAFKDIQSTIRANEDQVVSMPKRKPFQWRNIAAVAAILIVCSVVYLGWPALTQRFAQEEFNSLNIPAHQIKHLILPDGSQVWVNAESKLKYPKTFGGKKREVWLSGEAYFDVDHDSQRPFIIHTGNLITTVLGTAFNIKEDNLQRTIDVTVTRGKVSVANGSKLVGILTPNQQITFNTSVNKGIQRNVDAQQVIAWQQSDLHFEDVTFADAAIQLERHFAVQISFNNEKIKGCRFTGTFLKGQNLDKILKVMCSFNNSTYKREGNGHIIIEGKGCE